jgi:hypothetical protein
MAQNARILASGTAAWAAGPLTARRAQETRRPPIDPSDLTDEQLDGILMLAMDDPSIELPGLDDCLARNEDVLAPTSQPSIAHEQAFLRDVIERGLIKQERPLSWREYLGALLPSR